MNSGLGLLAEADEEEAFGGETGWRVQQEGLVGAGLVFAGCEHRGCRGRDRRVGGEKHGRRFGVGAFFGLGVYGWDSEQFCLNFGKSCKRQRSFHRFLRLRFRSKRRSIAAAMFIGVDGGAGFAVGLAAALGFSLVPVLFTLGQGQFALDTPIAEVKPGGDERVSLDLRL